MSERTDGVKNMERDKDQAADTMQEGPEGNLTDAQRGESSKGKSPISPDEPSGSDGDSEADEQSGSEESAPEADDSEIDPTYTPSKTKSSELRVSDWFEEVQESVSKKARNARKKAKNKENRDEGKREAEAAKEAEKQTKDQEKAKKRAAKALKRAADLESEEASRRSEAPTIQVTNSDDLEAALGRRSQQSEDDFQDAAESQSQLSKGGKPEPKKKGKSKKGQVQEQEEELLGSFTPEKSKKQRQPSFKRTREEAVSPQKKTKQRKTEGKTEAKSKKEAKELALRGGKPSTAQQHPVKLDRAPARVSEMVERPDMGYERSLLVKAPKELRKASIPKSGVVLEAMRDAGLLKPGDVTAASEARLQGPQNPPVGWRLVFKDVASRDKLHGKQAALRLENEETGEIDAYKVICQKWMNRESCLFYGEAQDLVSGEEIAAAVIHLLQGKTHAQIFFAIKYEYHFGILQPGRAVEFSEPPRWSKSEFSAKFKREKGQDLVTFRVVDDDQTCVCCNGEHNLRQCERMHWAVPAQKLADLKAEKVALWTAKPDERFYEYVSNE